MIEDSGNFETGPEVVDTPEPAVEAPNGRKYVMFGDNTIALIDYDKDAARTNIAKLDNGLLVYESEQTKAYHAKVSQYLKDNGIEFDGVYVKDQSGKLESAGGTQSIPPPPRKNKRDGDKTAAYVEWLQKYKPDEFNQRYGIQGQGQVTKTRPIPDPEIPGKFSQEAYKVPALLSRRKTHLTERPDQVQDEGYEAIPPKPEKGFE
jgi:hypothetical protein